MSENDENLTIVLLRDDPGISNPGDHDVIRSRRGGKTNSLATCPASDQTRRCGA